MLMMLILLAQEIIYLDIDKITPKMKKYNLIINKDKTEYVKLKRDTDRKKETWRE